MDALTFATRPMPRLQKIWEHPLYQEAFYLLQKVEEDRIFCNHTMEHFLDVARLMYLETLENSYPLDKELIYSTALLHDIGRYEQYCGGLPHHESGARLAGRILPDCGFTPEECQIICDAIRCHRHSDLQMSLLATLLYRADKKSRNCFCCAASDQCKWPPEKKNLQLVL